MLRGGNARISRHIRNRDGFVTIDFRGCSSRAISEVYQVFALCCARQQVRWAMLKVDEEDADAHFALRDTLVTLARIAGIPLSFKLALVAASASARNTTYPTVLADLAALGCEVGVFATAEQASQWLLRRTEGPARPAETAIA